MTDVTCPLCDYTGSVRSVEAHISGSSRGEHRGSVGRQFREELVDQAEQNANAPVGIMETGEERDTSSDEVAADAFAVLPESDEGEGVEDPVEDAEAASGWGVVAATVMFALVVLAMTVEQNGSNQSSSQTESEIEEETESESTSENSGPVPLVE